MIHTNWYLHRKSAFAGIIVVALLVIPGCPPVPVLPGSSTIDYLSSSDAVVGGDGRLRITLVDPVSTATVVSLTSSNPAVVSVPETATIPAGGNNVEVAFNGWSVGGAQITATLADSAQSTPVSVFGAMRVQGIDIPDPVLAGSSTILEVELGMTAPADTTVTLSSSDPAVLAVPPTIVVQEFEAYKGIVVTAGLPGSATITATLGSSTVSQAVRVVASASVAQLYTYASSAPLVGAPVEITVRLNTYVASDTVVELSSSNPGAVAVPTTVTVPAGSAWTTLTLTPLAAGNATITASLNGSSASTQLRAIAAPSIEHVSLSPWLRNGVSTTLGIWLDAAPLSDTSVSLTSTNPDVLLFPESITVLAGQRDASVRVTPLMSGSTLVTASMGSSSFTVATSVAEISSSLASVHSPGKLLVGAVSSVGVSLSTATETNTLVTFTSSDPAMLAMPASSTIIAGDSYTDVPVQALAAGTTNVQVTALGETFTASIEIVAEPSISFVSPGTLAVGKTAFLTVFLDVAVAADTTITLTNSEPTVVQVPSTVVVPAGRQTGSVLITGLAASPPDATITATLGASVLDTTVTVWP